MTVHPGELISFMADSRGRPFASQIVRLLAVHPHLVTDPPLRRSTTFPLTSNQLPIPQGSYMSVAGTTELHSLRALTLAACIMPTRLPRYKAGIFSKGFWTGPHLALLLRYDGALVLRVAAFDGHAFEVSTFDDSGPKHPITVGSWHFVGCTYDGVSGNYSLYHRRLTGPLNAQNATSRWPVRAGIGFLNTRPLILAAAETAAATMGHHFNGKISSPFVIAGPNILDFQPPGLSTSWSFARTREHRRTPWQNPAARAVDFPHGCRGPLGLTDDSCARRHGSREQRRSAQ